MSILRLLYFAIAINSGLLSIIASSPLRNMIEREIIPQTVLADCLNSFFSTLCLIFLGIVLKKQFSLGFINAWVFGVTAVLFIFEVLEPQFGMTFDYYDLIAILAAGFTALGINTWLIYRRKNAGNVPYIPKSSQLPSRF